jgi:hypothetical protein
MKQRHLSTRSFAVALVAAGLAVACNEMTQPTANTTSSTPSTTTPSGTAGGGATCATGDGVNDACSCDADAQRYCAGFYAADWESYARTNGFTTASWKYGLLDCLGKHETSASCKASLARRETLNAQMMAACGRYCRGTTPQPGAEPCVDQLKSIYSTLDNACRIALDAHEAAKPLNEKGPL